MARFDNIRFGTQVHWHGSGLGWGYGLSTINAANESMAWFFQVQESDIITSLGVRFATISGTPGTYRISLRNILGNGTPSTSLITGESLTPISSWTNTFQWFDLTAPLSVGRGQFICMVLEHISGAAGSVQVWRTIQGDSGGRKRGFPYFSFTGSGGATVKEGEAMVFGYRSSLRTYGLPLENIEAPDVQSPAHRGMRVFLNSLWGNTFKLRGCRFQGRLSDRAGRSVDMVLWQGTTELSRATFSGDVPPTHGHDRQYDLRFTDSVMPDLSFGTEYFLTFAPQEADTNFAIRTLVLPSTQEMTSLPGSSSFYLVDRHGLGSWTTSKNKRPMMNLYIEDWTKD